MATFLLDTNACIAIRNSFRGVQSKDAAKRAAHDRLIARWRGMQASDLAMSFVSLGELTVWVEKHTQAQQARSLLDRLVQCVQVVGIPDDRAKGGAHAVAGKYGQVRAALEKQGSMIPHNDLWIAAHALALGLTVVTGDISDFGRVPGLAVEDWTA